MKTVALILFSVCLLIGFMLGRETFKPKTEPPVEIISSNKQCYDDPLPLNEICKSYLETVIQEIRLKSRLEKWEEGYQEGYKKASQIDRNE